eukprot:CAMPEP_0117026322 /NCGR_PEP_ID=MMETSP0472-20121206/19367_1 /TAXON_ID=693140 ORGANISM="Tiarina fusus, Strain LIS" /NCGR_SAMPLE_ID=MMETSP0472 /ASSEMBLY_ACC=CAM_ASM_000603 /LENGTH=261 /DNA_ID=CAMNT_0004733305 /DNA_START=48 /DNA_END=833 /DNA_ORIENTATION=+
MAPNRKNLTGLLQALSSSDLESLQSSVQPKFLPLTHPVEQAKQQQQQHHPQQTTQPQTPRQPQNESASYWEWTSEDVVEEAEPVDLFSASRLEANLIKDANAAAQQQESQQVAAHDDYWAEADQQQISEQAVVETAPQHVDASYWDWTSKQEESQSYWEWESPKVAPHVVNPSAYPSKANYWDWETQESVKAVLESEAAREFLAAANIVRQLQAAAPVSSSGTKSSSDDYWTGSEHLGDEYWQAASTPVVAATGSAGYWDM